MDKIEGFLGKSVEGKKSRIPARLDFIQSASGLFLGLFIGAILWFLMQAQQFYTLSAGTVQAASQTVPLQKQESPISNSLSNFAFIYICWHKRIFVLDKESFCCYIVRCYVCVS